MPTSSHQPRRESRSKHGPRSDPDELLFHPDERFRLDPASPIPLYHQMEKVVLDRIRSAGDTKRIFPTEADLGEIFGVSRATIRKVTEALSSKGLIQRRRSVGTQIVSTGVAEDLGRLTSFTEQMRARGLSISTQMISAALEKPPQLVAVKLNLDDGERVLSIRRLRGTSEAFPFVLLHSYIPERFGVSSHEDFTGSLYELLEGKYGMKIEWADEEISAANANAEEAAHLRTAPGSTLLVMERLTFGPNNQPLEFVRASYLPQHYKFTAKMRR